MTAKEIQLDFIKYYLKPTLKHWGYKTSGQAWWKEKDKFYTLINLQNYSWNTKNEVDFCFNIGVIIKKENVVYKKPTGHNLTVYLREAFYLPDHRKDHLYRNESGYTLTDGVNMDKFISEIKIDFEQCILPYLESLKTLEDCLNKFGEITFWGEQLKKVLKENHWQV